MDRAAPPPLDPGAEEPKELAAAQKSAEKTAAAAAAAAVAQAQSQEGEA